MLVIRLRRTGRINQAAYDIVVAEKANAVKGKFLEKVGSYNPSVNPKKFAYDLDRIKHWIGSGARPSDTLASLLKSKGVEGMGKFIEKRNKKRKNKKAAAEEPAPVSAPANDAVAPAVAPANDAATPATEEAPKA